MLQFRHNCIQREAAILLSNSPRFLCMREIDSSIPFSKFQKITAKLPRRHLSLLAQLRTGHVPLNKHLYKIAKTDSPTCPACRSKDESVHHYIMTCQAYRRRHNRLDAGLSRNSRSLQYLLSNPKAFRTLEFISSTKRFESTFCNLELEGYT
jgi:hypothetical protein